MKELILFRPISSEPDAVESSINDTLQLLSVFHLATLSEHLLGFFWGKPRGVAFGFVSGS
ncbi:MAG TPA: hypothetical protein VJX16_20900 [Terriglobales bacterium]|nr:hypothetical protein [Terriglobales bacterium]